MGATKPRKSVPSSFSRLETRVVHVTNHTIRKKWKKLPSSVHGATRDLILSSKTQSRAGKSVPSSQCIDQVAARLIEDLPRLPLPPSSDECFDLEANLQRTRRMEEQVSNNLNSMALLLAQIDNEKKLLARDRREVEQLESALKTSEVYRRDQVRTMHPVARGMGDEIDLLDGHFKPRRNDAEFETDEEVAAMLRELKRHLGSMRMNTELVQVKEALEEVMGEVAVYRASLDVG